MLVDETDYLAICKVIDTWTLQNIFFKKNFNFFPSRRLLSNGSLFFSTVQHTRTSRPDEGLYQCVAKAEKIGTIVSRTATLKVAGKTRFTTFQLKLFIISFHDVSIKKFNLKLFHYKVSIAMFQLQHLNDDF
jgi:hypothetical protein